MENQTVIENFLKHKQKNNKSRRPDGLSKETIRVYRLNLEYLDKAIKKPYKEMTREDIEDFLDGYKQSSKNTSILLFRDFFRWLYNLEDDEPLPDVIRKIKPRNIERDDVAYAERVITEEEYTLLLDNCNKPMHKAILEAFWITGGRKGEIQTILVKDVSYDGNDTKVVIRESKSKTRVVVNPGRAEHLMKWKESLCPVRENPDAPLFVTLWNGANKPLGRCFTWELVDGLCKKAKLRGICVHDFRHTYATRLLKQGVPDTHIKTLLGWAKNSNMLKVYDHNSIKDYQEWLDKRRVTTPPTFELLRKQKDELESKHEKQIQNLNERLKQSEETQRRTEENITQIIQSLEPYKEELANIVRNKAVGHSTLVLANEQKVKG